METGKKSSLPVWAGTLLDLATRLLGGAESSPA